MTIPSPSYDGFTLFATLGIIAAMALAYLVVVPQRIDPKEPPMLRPRIPFVGHLVGLISLAHSYHRLQYNKYQMPICTLPILGGKLYVINSPEFAQSAILNRSLSFEPYVTDFIRRMTDVGDKAMKIYEDPAFFSRWLKIVYSSLTGPHLLAVNSAALRVVVNELNELPVAGVDVPDLFLWARDLISLASTTALFGDKNPWKLDPRLLDAYWDYERDIVAMMINIAPSITAPKAFRGRALMQKALTEYLASEYDAGSDVPKFTRDRMELEREFGMTPSEMAGLEVAVIHGAISNTIPTAYWMLVYVFSNPDLVAKLRAEAETVVTETSRAGPGEEGRREVSIDISRLEQNCPLLFSTLRETQRFISNAVLNRKIMADTTISDGKNSYLLKQGFDLQISHGVTHNLESVWGSNVRGFDSERFLDVAKPEDGLAVQPGAYTPFGAGKHICPGRFFASGEIMGFMVPLLLGFELTDQKGGAITVPDATIPWITTPIAKPVAGSNLGARLHRRVGWENVVWNISQ
ncbi:25-hydroxycholesterol 7-alpha-hydroxylase [Echria macrotheca]|uniref:25-hydroxycholesterol 7-alpha-hydroxylase n=1 Tax=Echria macrotheca TaxID=438768 RepID=A0AAJ0BIV3_9PEZI|nr:25-hydroxycholesterol 7-alpha-hydroxylase [Echria macrotheca]